MANGPSYFFLQTSSIAWNPVRRAMRGLLDALAVLDPTVVTHHGLNDAFKCLLYNVDSLPGPL